MVELQHVSAGYGAGTILTDISLSFPDGQITAIVGPNGSGKSTLIRTIAGLADLKSGRVLLDGRDTGAMTPRERAKAAAYLPQTRPVPDITARRLVLHGRFPYLGYPRRYSREDHNMVDAALKAVGAEAFAHEKLTALSGGQCQRVYIAVTLAQNTRTVLLDEPTNCLDVRYQMELMHLARDLAEQGKAVVMVLHDLCLAMRFADRIALISRGRLLCAASAEEVYASGEVERIFGVGLRRTVTENGPRYYYE